MMNDQHYLHCTVLPGGTGGTGAQAHVSLSSEYDIVKLARRDDVMDLGQFSFA
jgi:hypothetical protein